MPNFQQPQEPTPYRLDELEAKVHQATSPILGGIGGIGAFFYGLAHPQVPLVLPVIVGVIGGLLAVPLLKHLTAFLITSALVVAAMLGAWWLFSNEAALRRPHADPAVQTAPTIPAKSSLHGLLDDLKKGVE